MQQRGPNLEQRLERIRHKLPGEQKAERNGVVRIIISTVKTKPDPVQQLDRNLAPPESAGMRAILGPIYPGNAPVRTPVRRNNIEERGNVVLVRVTRRRAVVPENWVIGSVGGDVQRRRPVGLEPLGALPPVGEGDGREHTAVVTAAADFSGIVVGRDEGVFGVDEVIVDGGEIVERDAAFGE